MLGCVLDLQHAVETGVARNGYIGQADSFQQLLAFFILHIEMGEAFQDASILLAIPAEEHLPFAEDTADAIYGHTTMLKDVQVVIPELVLDEESHLGPYGTQEATGVRNRVER